MADISETAELSWESLIPELSEVFFVDKADVYYRLYEDAVEHLKLILPLPSLTCDWLSQTKPASQWHPSFGTLVNILADTGTDGEAATPPSHMKSRVTLDFLLLGIQYVVAVNLSLSPPLHGEHYHITCNQIKHSGRAPSEKELYRAAFLDIITDLWKAECTARQRAEWSPMPWSRASSLESHIDPQSPTRKRISTSIRSHIIDSITRRSYIQTTTRHRVRARRPEPHRDSCHSILDGISP